jgi:hypothetical protein
MTGGLSPGPAGRGRQLLHAALCHLVPGTGRHRRVPADRAAHRRLAPDPGHGERPARVRCYRRDDSGSYVGHSIDVLTVHDGRITDVTAYLDAEMLAPFRLLPGNGPRSRTWSGRRRSGAQLGAVALGDGPDDGQAETMLPTTRSTSPAIPVIGAGWRSVRSSTSASRARPARSAVTSRATSAMANGPAARWRGSLTGPAAEGRWRVPRCGRWLRAPAG